MSDNFTVTVYNPIARSRHHYVRVPVTGDGTYVVTGPTAMSVNYQVSAL